MTHDMIPALCHSPDSCAAAPDAMPEESASIHASYQRCVSCTHLGHTCAGPKLAALGTFDAVRAYHRLLRSTRGITVARVCAAAPQLGHGTVQDYFGRGGPDPKWITVSLIDSALVAICGNRVGQPPLESPCPALYADLHDRNETLAQRLTDAEQENAKLAEALATAEEKHLLTLRDQSAVMQSQLDFARERMEAAEARAADYLARNDAKSAQLETLRAEIRELNKEILRLHAAHAKEIGALYERVLALAGLNG